jgi:hypothetical protein
MKKEKSCLNCFWCEEYDDVFGDWQKICLKWDIFINDDNFSKVCKKFCERDLENF